MYLYVKAPAAEAMDAFLASPLAAALALQSQQQLENELVNDAYKPKMHKLYTQLYRSVSVDFILNVRKSPFPLRRMQEEVCNVHDSGSSLLSAVCPREHRNR